MKAETRHVMAYRIGRVLAGPVLRLYLRLEAIPVPALPYPYMAVINHSTDLDLMLPFGPFKKQMYFVAGETLFRGKILAWFLSRYYDPIIKQKGSTDMSTVVKMIRRIKGGHNLCLFAEGNTTFDGHTGAFPAATGGLIRASGAGLVTYRFEGGYLTMPRWSKHLRRGRIRGKLAHVYTPDDLACMTGDQINMAIARDIQMDDLAANAADPVRYRSRKRAEGLENVLYLCPRCEKIGTITGSGSGFACACGMRGEFTELGQLAGGSPFSSVGEWCLWQRERLAAMIGEAGGKPVLLDTGQTLCLQQPDHGLKAVTSGTLMAGAEGFSLGEMRFPLDSITGLALYRRNTLLFTAEGSHYQVQSAHERNGLKYRDLYEIVKGKKG